MIVNFYYQLANLLDILSNLFLSLYIYFRFSIQVKMHDNLILLTAHHASTVHTNHFHLQDTGATEQTSYIG